MTPQTSRRRQSIFVGSKIRELRKERGLTQSALALRIGVQQSDLCRMENGEYKVSLDTLFKILGVFGMPIGEFFRDEHAPATENELELLTILPRLSDRDRQEVLEFARYKASRRSEMGDR